MKIKSQKRKRLQKVGVVLQFEMLRGGTEPSAVLLLAYSPLEDAPPFCSSRLADGSAALPLPPNDTFISFQTLIRGILAFQLLQTHGNENFRVNALPDS